MVTASSSLPTNAEDWADISDDEETAPTVNVDLNLTSLTLNENDEVTPPTGDSSFVSSLTCTRRSYAEGVDEVSCR